MLELNLPPCEINIKKDGENLIVFDRLRAKYVALTPEEWVRQNFINYLIPKLINYYFYYLFKIKLLLLTNH